MARRMQVGQENGDDRSSTMEVLKQQIGQCVYESLKELCGGVDPTSSSEEKKKNLLREISFQSICFPNKQKTDDLIAGKPHDIEVRAALTLFHRWKNSQRDQSHSIQITSNLGLVRTIPCPRQLSQLLCLTLEQKCRERKIANHVQTMPSGIIAIVTTERAQLLQAAGRLSCPQCTHWCKGEKGLWWHQQQKHKVEHSIATTVADSATNALAIIPYSPFFSELSSTCFLSSPKTPSSTQEDPWECFKSGDLQSALKWIKKGFDPSTTMDRKGAFPLHWAAGGGHLALVQYLIEETKCPANQPQQGKRGFRGRTPLHWSARNGHFDVVKYLVSNCHVNLEDTTVDGTTAFGWACWQGHLPIMRFLHENGCNAHATNSFGCNAVLWNAQGDIKDDLLSMEWLASIGCNLFVVNHNGHGILHKAAQRGKRELCEWFVNEHTNHDQCHWDLVAPDSEGYCPSDLAGMEGHESLARFLADWEMNLIMAKLENPRNNEKRKNTGVVLATAPVAPSWLGLSKDCSDGDDNGSVSMRLWKSVQYNWEPYGGLRRMKSKILNPNVARDAKRS